MGLKPGIQIAERYRVERVIVDDQGGTILATREGRNGLLVAVKVFPATTPDTQLISRFRRAQNIETAHAPKLFELGATDDGRTFVAMEYLNGARLTPQVAQGSMPVHEAADAVRQACLAVDAAHKAGVIHRRLTTSKLFVSKSTGGGTMIRVLGFATTAPAAELAAGELPEDLDYLAPEQLSGVNNGDRNADIWALGVILYELLTGRLPFTGLTRKAVAKQILGEDPKPPRSLRPEVPWQLEQAVLRCLEKVPSSRVESAETLANMLRPFTAPPAEPIVERVGRTPSQAPPTANAPLPSLRMPKTPSELPDVTKLNHLLSGDPTGPISERTPAFHRMTSDGQIEGMKAEEVVDIARARRIETAAKSLKEDARQRKSASVPPVSREKQSAPPSRTIRTNAPSAAPPPSLSTGKIVAILIAAAVVLGLGTGLIVRALFP